MNLDKPILIDDVDSLRKSVLALDTQACKRADIWKMVRNCARSAPVSYPWYTPFVALITREPQDIENAKKVLDAYLGKLEDMYFCSGLQLHFWCFAFPHAKWAIYFQWLCSIGAYTPAEADAISHQFVEYQFLNFYYGMNTKPEPECVDNQTLSLALSCAIVGYLFSNGGSNGDSEMAKIMYRDGLRRVPMLLGSMPASGYTGEGSAYMDCVISPAMPIAVEMLQLFTGEKDLIFKAYAPNELAPLKLLEMTAREWMPGGLLLPWDNYGYQHGSRCGMAYAARKTGEQIYYDILEKHCILSYDVGVGWAFDDFVWTLVWWPDQPSKDGGETCGWFEPEVGGAVYSKDSSRYLAQLWDESAPEIPTRCHANPGMVLFNGYRTPLSADGSSLEGSGKRFYFEDTYREVSFLTLGQKDVYNYGNGCGGGHSIVLVDGWEGMRAFSEYPQTTASSFKNGVLFSDTTPIYRERWADANAIRRKSALHHDAFFTVEDYVSFGESHDISSRFVLRPDFVPCEKGLKIETPEGVTLHIFDVLGSNEIITEEVEGHPKKPDGKCVLADFHASGKEVRRLFVAFISRTRAPLALLDNILCVPDNGYSYLEAVAALEKGTPVSMRAPAFMEADLPVKKGWWYKKHVEKQPGKAWLVIPGGHIGGKLWVNGEELPLCGYAPYSMHLREHIALPADLNGADSFEMVFYTNTPVSHYEGDANGASVGLWGGMSLCYPCEEEAVIASRYENGVLAVTTTKQAYEVPYTLMED